MTTVNKRASRARASKVEDAAARRQKLTVAKLAEACAALRQQLKGLRSTCAAELRVVQRAAEAQIQTAAQHATAVVQKGLSVLRNVAAALKRERDQALAELKAAQAQAKELALQEVAEEEQRLLAEAKAAGTSVSAFAKAKMHEAHSPQP